MQELLQRVYNMLYMARVRSVGYDFNISNQSWLIPDGDIDKWSWRTPDLVLPHGGGPTDLSTVQMRAWTQLNDLQRTFYCAIGDLHIGALGGHDGNCRCICNAPLFDNESKTKCCLFRQGLPPLICCFLRGVGLRLPPAPPPPSCSQWRTICNVAGNRAGWYGPFCSYPFIPRAGHVAKQSVDDYSDLWDSQSEEGQFFRANTRLYNSRYAFSSLQAEQVHLPGKPVFKLKGIKGQVHYCMAPTMDPPMEDANGQCHRPAR